MTSNHKGIALPWGITVPSVLDPKDDRDVLKSSVIWIVLTATGERVMLPEFGTPIMSLLFDPADPTTLQRLKQEVRDAIARWDNRVTFLDLTVEKRQNSLTCSIFYKFAQDPFRDDEQRAEFTLSQTEVTVVL